MNKINLKSYTLEELENFVHQMGQPSYRTKQIYKWIYRGQTDFEKMTDLPKSFIKELEDVAFISSLKIYKKYASDDGTIKYVFALDDKNIIEGVKMKYSFGTTACISSQVGCAMGCAFCASTQDGLVRNLAWWEMADEVLAMEKDLQEKVSRVVVMGSGEPLLNYKELIKFLRILNSPLAFNISYRRITVSTCGIVPYIISLADENIPVTLAISLHAPNDAIRNSLMPINKTYPISQLLDAARYYIMKTKRRITFEYILILDVNDTKECAYELCTLLKGLLCHVNLIPFNPVEGKEFKRSDDAKVREFEQILLENNISATVRRETGADINAACGQLRRSLLER